MTQDLSVAEALQRAVVHHQAGRLDEAAGLYRGVLERQPAHPDALHLLGVIAYQRGEDAEAASLIERALAARPGEALFHSNLGNALKNLGRAEEALAAYRRAVDLDPTFADAHNNLGSLLRERGLLGEAVFALRAAVRLQPDHPEANRNLGLALLGQKRFAEAAERLRASLARDPDNPVAHGNLGLALKELGQLKEAGACCRRALALRPAYAGAHANLGLVLLEEKRPAEAAAAFGRAVDLDPALPGARLGLGNALLALDRPGEAEARYREELARDPESGEAHSNLGNALLARGRAEEAVAAYRRAVALRPDFPAAHKNLGMALLALGRLEEGWPHYERRWETGEFAGIKPDFPQPLWDGAPLAGRTLLLYGEQGLGDAIQFVRYVPRIAKEGRVFVVCAPPLVRLFAGVEGVERALAASEAPPPFDVHASLVSLPGLLGTREETIPREAYLRPPAGEGEEGEGAPAWPEALLREGEGGEGEEEKEAGGPRVGLVWAGNPGHGNDRNRSIALEKLRPLLEVEGVRFFSLQVGAAAADLGRLGLAGAVCDLSPALRDFADTAAALARLDLLISVDSAPVHLAGGMGRPVWTLLPFAPDWRWMLGREDTPWYPTMRLFRQAAPGEWEAVIARVRAALEGFRAGG